MAAVPGIVCMADPIRGHKTEDALLFLGNATTKGFLCCPRTRNALSSDPACGSFGTAENWLASALPPATARLKR